jgi:hypothetical protein
MRKFTLLFLTLLVTTLSYAQVSTTRQKTKVHLNAEQQQKVSPQVEKKTQTVDYRSLNINVRKLTDVNKALLSDKKMNAANGETNAKQGLKKADDEGTTIRTPKGTPYTYSLLTYINDGWNLDNYIGGLSDTIYVDGTDVYFKNIVYVAGDGSYVKGSLTSGDIHNGSITVKNGQECANGIYARVGKVTSDNTLTIDSTATEFTFSIVNDTIEADVDEGNYFFLLGIDSNGGFVGYNAGYKYEPVDESKLQPVTPPEGLETSDYREICKPIDGYTQRAVVKIGKSGNDFYLTNMMAGTAATIKGTLNSEGKIEFSLPEYIGKYNGFFYYLRSGKVIGTIDEDGDSTYYYQLNNNKKMTFDYDAATGTITSNDLVCFMMGNEVLGTSLYNPTFYKINDVAVVVPSTAKPSTYVLVNVTDPSDNSRSQQKVTVSRDGNDFYFMGNYANYPEFAFKGTLDGDSISVKVPQLMGMDDGQYVYLNAVDIETVDYGDEIEHYYFPLDSIATFKFGYNSKTNVITSKNTFAPVPFAGSINSSLCNPVWYLFTDTVATVPEDATIDTYVPSVDNFEGKRVNNSLVRIANKDNTYYFLDHNSADPNVLFCGKLNGNKLTIPCPQLVDSVNLVYLYPCIVDSTLNDNGEYDISLRADSTANEIVFDYDSNKGLFSYNGAILWQDMTGSTINLYYKPQYIKYVKKPATPANPLPELWMDMTADNGKYLFEAVIPHTATDGSYLDPEGMSYRIYFDDKLFTFDCSQYTGLTENKDEIPYLFSDEQEFFIDPSDATARMIWLFSKPDSRIGVQSAYTCNDEKHYSDIEYYDIPTDGISNITGSSDKNMKSESYYDLTGRKVSEPKNGIFVHKITFADGTSKIYKQVIK